MAHKKKTEPLIGMTRDPDNKLTVQKSRPLTALWQSNLSLAEFKILDAYLARINSQNPDQRTVELPKGELESSLGVKRINREDLKKRLKTLSSTIDLDPDNKKKLHQVCLFEEAKAEQDEDGIWQINLTCTPTAMKYFFNIEKLGYLRYKLRCITSLTSRYTYILFIYLESNRFRESWEIELGELKQILNCHKDELYKEFKMFNQRILKRAQNELAEKTECRFTYEPVRRGRSVAIIRFNLEMLSPKIEAELKKDDTEQLTVFDDKDELAMIESRYRRTDEIGMGFESEYFDEFSDEQLIELKSLAMPLVDEEDMRRHHQLGAIDSRSYAVAEYIVQKIKTMNVYASREKIRDRYNYLKQSIINEKE